MSIFNKRHYEAIATAMQWAARASHNCTEQAGVEITIREVADMLAADNGAFQRERFIRACEPGANVRKRA